MQAVPKKKVQPMVSKVPKVVIWIQMFHLFGIGYSELLFLYWQVICACREEYLLDNNNFQST